MKKSIFSIFAMVLATVFTSCEKNENFSRQNTSQTTLMERFEVAQKAAGFHSGVLSAVFDTIQELKRTKGVDFVRQSFLYEQEGEILDRVFAVYFGESVAQELCQFNSFPLVNNLPKEDRGKVLIKSVEANTSEIAHLTDFYSSTVSDCMDLDANRRNIISAINSQEIASAFSEEEQNTLLLMFAVFIDSYNYWTENINEWDGLFEVGQEPENPDLPSTPEGLKILKKIVALAMIDGQGIIDNKRDIFKAALAGAGSGALIGLGAGGVNAATGALLGGMGAATGASVACAALASYDAYIK
ncbi:MAG: hypothetical protein LBS01_11500 [Prevotellaceae bacterium]|jgi:hypothetical protein|nr:hypothetical protein [Prevotellaceae bacterium]